MKQEERVRVEGTGENRGGRKRERGEKDLL